MRIDEAYLAKICDNLKLKYPDNLAKRYYRIMDKILTYWTEPESMNGYISSLIIDDRGDRAGFPEEVLNELLMIQKIHDIWVQNVLKNPNFKLIDYEKEILSKQRQIDGNMMNKLRVLNTAIQDEDIEIIQTHLKEGFYINQKNEDGMTLLHICAMLGKEEMTRELLELGASINVFDNIGFSPMHWAIQNDRKEIFFMILEKHPFVNHASKQNKTPLWIAVSKNYDFLVKQLLEAKGNPNIQDNITGDTALHRAVINKNPYIFRLLLTYGGDMYIMNKKKESPLSLARIEQGEMLEICNPYRQDLKNDSEFIS